MATVKPLRNQNGRLAEFSNTDVLPEANVPATAGIPKHGITALRLALATTLGINDTGNQFYDTEEDRLYVWVNNRWEFASVAPANYVVRDYYGTADQILGLNYKGGDRWTDPTAKYIVRVCRVTVITHTIADWVAIGAQNDVR